MRTAAQTRARHLREEAKRIEWEESRRLRQAALTAEMSLTTALAQQAARNTLDPWRMYPVFREVAGAYVRALIVSLEEGAPLGFVRGASPTEEQQVEMLERAKALRERLASTAPKE